MDTITIKKVHFERVLDDVETLLHDVECAMSEEESVVKKRTGDIVESEIGGKNEEDYLAYLKGRRIAIDNVDRQVSHHRKARQIVWRIPHQARLAS